MVSGDCPNARPQLLFARKLVLNQWLLGLFGVERIVYAPPSALDLLLDP